MKKKPVVWYVDDIPENLTRFEENHGHTFTVRTFAHPSQVVEALGDSKKPDALLCDIFFYETVDTAKDMELRVSEKAAELKKFGDDIGANQADQAGIRLIETVSERFRAQFPIYAYTSKGPYLLTGIGFDRIGAAGAKWLFKGKYGPPTERLILAQDIEDYRLRNSFTMRAARFFWVSMFGSGIVGGLVVWVLTEELPKLVGWRK